MAKKTVPAGKKDNGNDAIVINLTNFLTPISIIVGSIMIAMSFVLGVQRASINSIVANLSCDSNSPLSRDCLVTYAKDLGMDTGKFASCVDNGDFKKLVGDEITAATALGIQSTPTIYLGKGTGTKMQAVYLGSGAAYEDLAKLFDYAANNNLEAIKTYWVTSQLDLLQSFRDQVKAYYASSDGGSLTGDALEKKTDAYIDQQKQIITTDTVIKEIDLTNAKIEGSGDVSLIEFSDFECPYCQQFANQVLNQVKTNYIDKGKITFAFNDFPLEGTHPNARLAAEAARCAGAQDKYFAYHDKVFAVQGSTTTTGQ